MGAAELHTLIDKVIERASEKIAERVCARLAEHLGDGTGAPQAYLTVRQAAAHLALSKQQLDQWRCRGEGPPYVKLAQRVRYLRADLDAYMAARMQRNTGQNGRSRNS